MSLFEPVFAGLNRHAVRYVVVGGVAVVLHGHPRLTGDLDLAIDLSPPAATAAVETFSELGLQPRLPVDAHEFADPTIRQRWVQERNLEVFSFHDPANPLLEVDLFARDPLPFEELWQRAELMDVGGVRVPVASIPDLIRLKEMAGRSQDVSDINALREIEAHRRGHD